MPIDEVQLNFSPQSLQILNIILALILFGIALDLKLDDFKRVFKMPKAVLIGLTSQLILLPLLTLGLIAIFKPAPSLALGMLLVACCPGGNVSNFMVYLAKGNTALSVTLTSISTIAAIILTPVTFGLYGGVFEYTRPLLQTINVPLGQTMFAIFILVGVPLTLGMLLSHSKPEVANRLKRPMKIFSLVFFIAFLLFAIAGNADHFTYLPIVLGLILVHNFTALLTGFSMASLAKLGFADKKSIAIETGIQNSGLGLFMIFNFFDGNGGMAMVAAFWGIWHLISGLGLSWYWSKK